MKEEYTLSIIKPDAVYKSIIGEIYNRFEKSGLKIVAVKMLHLSAQQAERFYNIHKEKDFFIDLIKFMTSGPIIVQVLKGYNAVFKYRELIGSTDPKQAMPGTIRSDYANNINQNIVHGSDSIQSAYEEIRFFFALHEIYHL